MISENERWEIEGGRERMFSFDFLTNESIVFEVGMYKGLWTAEISKRYNPIIYTFEPVKRFYTEGVNKFSGNSKIRMFNFGLGSYTRDENFGVSNDASGLFCQNSDREKISIKSIFEFLEENNINHIDLAQINCEGGEYEILECLIGTSIITKFKNLQIQFHNVIQDSEERVNKIHLDLSKTHDLIYCYNFVFELWRIK